jgi:hypothetical protein
LASDKCNISTFQTSDLRIPDVPESPLHTMSIRRSSRPRLLGLFQKRIDGDDALLELARLRFKQAGMGVELYGDSSAEVDRLLDFKPWPQAPVVVHLSRAIDLLSRQDRGLIRHLVKTFSGRVYGFVIHDRKAWASRADDYRAALSAMNTAFLGTPGQPLLFVEYAAGLDFEKYCTMIESGRDFELMSACLDIGHLGIRQAGKAYSDKHPGDDICALIPADPQLPQLIDDVQAAVASVPTAVSGVVRRLAALGKPLHFHLHDGHPLSSVSPFGVSDHLSFFEAVPLPFTFQRKRNLATMFGPAGLRRIVFAARTALPLSLLSFTLEIHPAQRREPLADGAPLFHDWTDKTNAERMNGWLMTLMDNHRLLAEICEE